MNPQDDLGGILFMFLLIVGEFMLLAMVLHMGVMCIRFLSGMSRMHNARYPAPPQPQHLEQLALLEQITRNMGRRQ